MTNVIIPLATGCEELEAVTIIDLLRRANINVVTAGLDNQPVKASRGTVIVPDTVIDEVLDVDFDMIVLPGGLPGADFLSEDERIRKILVKMFDQGKYIAAICAAPKVLARAGILNNKQVTCYPGTLDALQIPGMQLLSAPVVLDGQLITSRGPGTAMDFALTLIEVLAGKEKRLAVEGPLQRVG